MTAVAPREGLSVIDPDVAGLLERDRQRHTRTLNFIASENYASPAVLECLASHLNVKYAEGYPRARYYQGVALVDDIVLGMELTQGGHLTHGSPVSFSGKFYNFVHYGVDPSTEVIDYERVADLAREHQPRL